MSAQQQSWKGRCAKITAITAAGQYVRISMGHVRVSANMVTGWKVEGCAASPKPFAWVWSASPASRNRVAKGKVKENMGQNDTVQPVNREQLREAEGRPIMRSNNAAATKNSYQPQDGHYHR